MINNSTTNGIVGLSMATTTTTTIGASAFRAHNYDVLDASLLTMVKAINERPLDLGSCLEALCTVSDVIVKTASSTFDGVAAGTVIEPPPCPAQLLRAAPQLLEFMISLHNVVDPHARVVENLAVNLMFKIVIMSSMHENERALRNALIEQRRLMFLLHAAKMQLIQFEAGRVKTEFNLHGGKSAAHLSFVRLPHQRDYLTHTDDYLWLVCLTLLKLGSEGLSPFFRNLAEQDNASGFVNVITKTTVNTMQHCISQILHTRFALLLDWCDESSIPLKSLTAESVVLRASQEERDGLHHHHTTFPKVEMEITSEGIAVIKTAAGIIDTVLTEASTAPENVGTMTRIHILKAASTVAWMAVVLEYLAVSSSDGSASASVQQASDMALTLGHAAVKLGELQSRIRLPKCALDQLVSLAISLAALDGLREARREHLLGAKGIALDLFVKHCLADMCSAKQLEGMVVKSLEEHFRLLTGVETLFRGSAMRLRLHPDSKHIVFREMTVLLASFQKQALPERRHQELVATAAAMANRSPSQHQQYSAAVGGSADVQHWQNMHRCAALQCEAANHIPSRQAGDNAGSSGPAKWRDEAVTDVCDALWQLSVFHLQAFIKASERQAAAEKAQGAQFSTAGADSFLAPAVGSVDVLDAEDWDGYEQWTSNFVEGNAASAVSNRATTLRKEHQRTKWDSGENADSLSHTQKTKLKRKSLTQRLQLKMLDVLSATKTVLNYEDAHMSATQFDHEIQAALWFLDELIALCLREGRKGEAAAFCQAFAPLLSHTHLTATLSTSLLVGAASLLHMDGNKKEAITAGALAAKYTSLLTGDLRHRALIEDSLREISGEC